MTTDKDPAPRRRETVVDSAWIARELAKAPKHLTEEQQRDLRRILAPPRSGRRKAP